MRTYEQLKKYFWIKVSSYKLLMCSRKPLQKRAHDNAIVVRVNMFSRLLVTKVVSVLLVYGQAVLLARLLQPAQFGVYSSFIAVSTIALVPALMGFPQLIQRDIRRKQEVSILQMSAGLWLKLYTILLAVFMFATDFLLDDHHLIIALLVIVFFTADVRLKSHALFGYGYLVLGQIADTLLKPLFILLLCAFYFKLEFSFDSSLAIWITALACCLVRLILKLPIFGIEKIWKEAVCGFAHLFTDIKASNTFFLISFSQILLINVWVILTENYSGSYDAGLLRVAIVISVGFGFLREIIDMVCRNSLIDMFKQNEDLNNESLSEIKTLYFRGSLISALGFITYIFWGKHIINFIFGDIYLESFVISLPLIMARIVETIFGPYLVYLQVNGYEKVAALMIWISISLGIIFYLCTRNVFGLLSASYAYLLVIICLRLSAYLFFNYSQKKLVKD